MLRLDAYLPVGRSAAPALIVVHGGGWRAGSREQFAPGEAAIAPRATALARHGYAVFAIDYRLAPMHPFPAASRDVEAAIRYVRANGRRLRIDPSRVGLLGASAGGNVAALVAMTGAGPLNRGARVRAIVSWSGPMSLARFDAELGGPAAHPFVEQFIGCAPSACTARYRAASPIGHVDSTDPPMLIATSSHEIVPLDQAQQMAQRLAISGVPHQLIILPGSKHAAEYASEVWQATMRFLDRYLKR